MTERADQEVTAYIGLGSNLDDPVAQVKLAICELAAVTGIAVTQRSSFYSNPPLGEIEQPDFINAVVEIRTTLTAVQLLKRLQEIEIQHGRQREMRWGPRTLDLDLLLYDRSIIDTETLTVPHPHLHERAFVLFPLTEINSEINVPGKGRVRDLLKNVNGESLARTDDQSHAW